LTVRCKAVTVTVGGLTVRLTTQSLTREHVRGNPAFSSVQTTAATGRFNDINDQQVILVGRDVFYVDAVEPPAPTRLKPNAALLALAARVEATR
jgi:hypothetical protein